MDPTPVYSGYSIFFGVIEGFDPPRAPLPLPPPEATKLQEVVDHPAAIIQVRAYEHGSKAELVGVCCCCLRSGASRLLQVLSPSKLFLVAGGKGPDKKLVWKLGYKTDSPPNRKEWVEGGKVRRELEAYLAQRAQYVDGWMAGSMDGWVEQAERPGSRSTAHTYVHTTPRHTTREQGREGRPDGARGAVAAAAHPGRAPPALRPLLPPPQALLEPRPRPAGGRRRARHPPARRPRRQHGDRGRGE